MTTHSTGDRLAAAGRYLRRALDNDAPDHARRAYELVGQAQAELNGTSLTAPPLRHLLLDELGSLLAGDPVLAARAAVDIATPVQFNEDLLGSLLARSGYQVLLDAGVWEEPPLSDFHLAEVDEALAEAVEHEGGVEVPAGIPATHTWWHDG